MTKAGGECEGTLPSSAHSFAGMVSNAGRERAPATTEPRFCVVYGFYKTTLLPSTERFAFHSLLLTLKNLIQNKSVSTWQYFG